MSSNRPAVALEARNAQITTCTVEIQTLRIGNRQLTQSVFKQLQKEDLVDPVAVLLEGEVWGWVNFDLSHPNHRNFIFQKDGRLYRSEFWIAYHSHLVHAPRDWFRVDGRWGGKAGTPAPPSSVRYMVKEGLRSGFYWADHEDRWNDLMDELSRVDQLFIAA